MRLSVLLRSFEFDIPQLKPAIPWSVIRSLLSRITEYFSKGFYSCLLIYFKYAELFDQEQLFARVQNYPRRYSVILYPIDTQGFVYA